MITNITAHQALNLLRDGGDSEKHEVTLDYFSLREAYAALMKLHKDYMRVESELYMARTDRYVDSTRHSKSISELRTALRKHACDCLERCDPERKAAEIYCGWEAQQQMKKYE